MSIFGIIPSMMTCSNYIQLYTTIRAISDTGGGADARAWFPQCETELQSFGAFASWFWSSFFGIIKIIKKSNNK